MKVLAVSATFVVWRDDGLGSRRNLLGVTLYEDLWANKLVFAGNTKKQVFRLPRPSSCPTSKVAETATQLSLAFFSLLFLKLDLSQYVVFVCSFHDEILLLPFSVYSAHHTTRAFQPWYEFDDKDKTKCTSDAVFIRILKSFSPDGHHMQQKNHVYHWVLKI